MTDLLYDDDAETVVLGTMFGPGASKAHVAHCIELLDEEDFGEKLRPVFVAIKQCFLDGEPLEHPLTVLHRLRRSGNLAAIGGSGTLLDLLHYAGSPGLARHHIKTVKWAARLRDWQRIRAEKLGSEDDAEKIAEAAQDLLASLKSGALKLPSPIEAQIPAEFDLFEENAREQTGLHSGLHRFDGVTGGFLPGQYVIFGAKTSEGKTSLLVQLAVSAARQKAKVLFISLEMTNRQVIHRILAQEAGVPVQQMTNPSLLTSDSWTRLVNAKPNIPPGIWTADGMYDIDSLVAKVRRAHAQMGGLDVLVVDYIQLVRASRNNKEKNRTQEVGEVSRLLKSLANDLGVCVLAASQLSRQHERDKRKPQLSDLRESGSLEHDADVVVFIYRPELDRDEPHLGGSIPCELIVAKNRNGMTGKTAARFNAPLNLFEEVA